MSFASLIDVGLQPGQDLYVGGNSATAHTYTMVLRQGAGGNPTRYVYGGQGAIFKGSMYSRVTIDALDASVTGEVGPEGVFGNQATFRLNGGLLNTSQPYVTWSPTAGVGNYNPNTPGTTTLGGQEWINYIIANSVEGYALPGTYALTGAASTALLKFNGGGATGFRLTFSLGAVVELPAAQAGTLLGINNVTNLTVWGGYFKYLGAATDNLIVAGFQVSFSTTDVRFEECTWDTFPKYSLSIHAKSTVGQTGTAGDGNIDGIWAVNCKWVNAGGFNAGVDGAFIAFYNDTAAAATQSNLHVIAGEGTANVHGFDVGNSAATTAVTNVYLVAGFYTGSASGTSNGFFVESTGTVNNTNTACVGTTFTNFQDAIKTECSGGTFTDVNGISQSFNGCVVNVNLVAIANVVFNGCFVTGVNGGNHATGASYAVNNVAGKAGAQSVSFIGCQETGALHSGFGFYYNAGGTASTIRILGGQFPDGHSGTATVAGDVLVITGQASGFGLGGRASAVVNLGFSFAYTPLCDTLMTLKGFINVTAWGANNVAVKVNYTDIHGTAQQTDMIFTTEAGATALNLAAIGRMSMVPITIRAKRLTAVTVANINAMNNETYDWDFRWEMEETS